ncbi:matrix-remodeling-associated protein 7 isoform X2 [Rhineura floridana]|uniref:matrix-remodeling-associated protein 7 isoform X2 n=1 Tax=Rhineura floridana TaxID=261503 RepID=UPI002AC87D49|nr:matrix-remodeling-associated protein 7 isoform X2 [Rhineura floridana]
MDVAVELYYLAVPLLFTVLAVVLASVFVKLRTSEGDKAAEAKEQGNPQAKEAKASAAVAPVDGDERIPDGEGEAEAGREGPHQKNEGGEGGRVPVEGIGAEEEKKKPGKEEQRQKEEEEEDAAAAAAAAAAARTAKAEEQSHPQEMKIMPSQAAAAVATAPVAVEEEEEEEEEDEEEEEEEEESKEEDQESENEKLVVREPETEDADEQLSFKYSPGKLRGNQYKTMMTKEELEEEQRTEDYMKLSLDSS